ncbi:mercury methylation corrinoid protein HgcA [Thermodesulfobacteriota bacterium]
MKKDEAQLSLPRLDQPFVAGSVQTKTGPIPKIFSHLKWADRWGNIKARWGVNRMNHKIDPGLYALGDPDDKSPVLVTANYKMSFDRLREALSDRNLWIIVLDTKGINVWCAAGKGSFGTEELVRRIEVIKLNNLISHRELILPQLSAPGVSAHKVRKLSGFKVIYGPILAGDLPVFLDADKKTTPEMRRKTFTTWERTVLIPVEMVSALKWALIISIIFFLLSGLAGPGSFWANALDHGLFGVMAIIWGLVAGTVLTPVLLPWLPGRAFSLKALIPALTGVVILTLFRAEYPGTLSGNLEVIAWFFIIPAISAYLAMNFTGCSTYTSLSGVKKEMKWAVPMEIAAGVIGIFLWIGSRFIV